MTINAGQNGSALLLQLIPSGETVRKTAHPSRWKAESGGVCFDIAVPEGVFPSGWVLFQGSLLRSTGDYDARLYYDLGSGFRDDWCFPLSSSSKGVINELICLPLGIKRMRFSPMGTAGEFELGPMTVSTVGAVERTWRMGRRILSMLFLHSRQKRKLINLTLPRMLVDLHGTYKNAGLLRAHAVAPQYQDWIRQFDELTAEDRVQINEHLLRFTDSPSFHILIVSESTVSDDAQKTLDSVSGQLYRRVTCVLLGNVADEKDVNTEKQDARLELTRLSEDQLPKWLAQFNGTLVGSKTKDWILLVRAGEVLAPHALYRFATEALAKPGAAVLYSDDDVLDVNGRRHSPRFKPDWSPEYIRSTNFVGNAVALRCGDVARAGGVSADACRYGTYDLLLKVVDAVGNAGSGTVAHIPEVLLHRKIDPSSENAAGSRHGDWDDPRWCMEAVRTHLVRNQVMGDVSESRPGCWRVRYRLPVVPPLVSIVVPTRDALPLVRQCVDALLEKTTYLRYEVLVVDNQSVDPGTLAYLRDIACRERVRVLHYDLPFNYSAMNNMAVREARGEAVCLLNNDTEVISPDWLEEMVGNLLQPGVGVVGAKLLFPNGQVQHCGDLVGVGGVANHAHAFLRRDDPGYQGRAVLPQDVSAVTGACLLVWKRVYEELGGLDKRHLPVAFNDVDFCLRARAAGYRIVWTPYAQLYHHESLSRGKDKGPEQELRAKREAAYMRKRWKQAMSRDPFYNPNLCHERPDFSLSKAPVVDKPWRA